MGKIVDVNSKNSNINKWLLSNTENNRFHLPPHSVSFPEHVERLSQISQSPGDVYTVILYAYNKMKTEKPSKEQRIKFKRNKANLRDGCHNVKIDKIWPIKIHMTMSP